MEAGAMWKKRKLQKKSNDQERAEGACLQQTDPAGEKEIPPHSTEPRGGVRVCRYGALELQLFELLVVR